VRWTAYGRVALTLRSLYVCWRTDDESCQLYLCLERHVFIMTMDRAQRQRPDLILVSLAGLPGEVLGSGRRIRESAAAGDDVPVVIFCFDEIPEGAEVAIGKNVHIAQPDNFNQLRRLLSTLLGRITTAA